MNPRKSSTSSGRARATRARYLGVEVVAQPLPSPSLPGWEGLLRIALERSGGPSVRFRIIRSDRRRAIVEISHTDLTRARTAWSATAENGSAGPLATRRTWGTLVGAKAWLKVAGPEDRPARPVSRLTR